jgi:hypothetical protein
MELGMVARSTEGQKERWSVSADGRPDRLNLKAGLGRLLAKQGEKSPRVVGIQREFLAGSRIDVENRADGPFSILLARPDGLNVTDGENSERKKEYSLFEDTILQRSESRGPSDDRKNGDAEIKRHHEIILLEHLDYHSENTTESEVPHH